MPTSQLPTTDVSGRPFMSRRGRLMIYRVPFILSPFVGVMTRSDSISNWYEFRGEGHCGAWQYQKTSAPIPPVRRNRGRNSPKNAARVSGSVFFGIYSVVQRSGSEKAAPCLPFVRPHATFKRVDSSTDWTHFSSCFRLLVLRFTGLRNKKPDSHFLRRKPGRNLVAGAGFEPTTFGL